MDNSFGKVMISYAWDNQDPAHHFWVSSLNDRLRSEGIQTTLDIKSIPSIGRADINKWMEEAVNHAEWILCVITEKYNRKCDDRTDGNSLGYEIQQIIAKFINKGKANRVIPLFRPSANSCPSYMPLAYWLDFRDNAKFEAKFSELIGIIKNYESASQIQTLNESTDSTHTVPTFIRYNILDTLNEHWRCNKDYSTFTYKNNPNVNFIIIKQPNWIIQYPWVIKALGDKAHKVIIKLQNGGQEIIFDFACDVNGVKFLPLPESDSKPLKITELGDKIASIINSFTFKGSYNTLKQSAGVSIL